MYVQLSVITTSPRASLIVLISHQTVNSPIINPNTVPPRVTRSKYMNIFKPVVVVIAEVAIVMMMTAMTCEDIYKYR